MASSQLAWNLPIQEGIFGVARYYTENDSMQHAIIATKNGTLYEVRWNMRTPPSVRSPIKLWQFKSLSCLAGVYSSTDGYQHVIVASNEAERGSLFDIAFKEPQCTQPRRLVRLPMAVQRVGMAGFFSPQQTLCVAIIAGNDGSLRKVTFRSGGQPTREALPLRFDAKITSIAGFFSLDDDSSHIITGLASGCVYDVNYSNEPMCASAHHLMHIASPPHIVAAFYSPNGKDRHVIARTNNGEIYTYRYSRSGQNKPLERLFTPSSYTGIVDIVAYDFVNDNRCHVIIATHNNLYDVYYPHLK